MKHETQFCGRCGTLLHGAQKVQGSCPRCLLELGLETPAVSSGPTAAPELEEVQALLPHYEILECIGKGGMGAVYRARQKSLQRVVALKVLLPELGRDPTFAERFLREAQALANLNHPGIVHVFDFGQAGDFWFFAMEFVDGASLRELVRDRSVSPGQALAMVSQICSALQYAHDQGVVHRDIKPENILVDRNGTVKITDFGLAKLITKPEEIALTRSDQVMGTLHYMAPEQVERPQQVDHRADIYSLGVVFYELLTGELPIGRFQPPSQQAEVDARLDEVVLRALEKRPERRWQRAQELETEVHRISNAGPVLAAASSAPPAAEPSVIHGGHDERHPRRSRHGLAIGIGCFVLILFGLAMVGAMTLWLSAGDTPASVIEATPRPEIATESELLETLQSADVSSARLDAQEDIFDDQRAWTESHPTHRGVALPAMGILLFLFCCVAGLIVLVTLIVVLRRKRDARS